VRSLQANIDKIYSYIFNLNKNPDIIAISETKLRKGQLKSNINLDNYTFTHVDSTTNAGGVGFCVKDDIEYEIINDIGIKINSVEDF